MDKWNSINDRLPEHEQVVLRRNGYEVDGKMYYNGWELRKFVNMGIRYPKKYHERYFVWKSVASGNLAESHLGHCMDVTEYDQWMSIDDD